MILGAVIRLRDQFTPTLTRIRRDTNTLSSRLSILNRMVIRPVVSVTDRASSVIGGISKKLTSLKALAAGIIIGGSVGLGMSKALGGAMKLEQQQISMQHFIGIQNEGMDVAQVKKEADQYVEWLRGYSNLTPFSTDEVIAGGSRAINVAGGDISKAKELAKLAGDMAALNPEKTYADAMEAIADLRVGETERMKEFGFKISADEIKAAGGVENIINEQITPFFKGGAEKLSSSSAGLWSTITGNLGTMLTTSGEGILEGLKPQLQKGVDWISENSDKITEIATTVGTGIGSAITTVSGWISEYMPVIKDGIATVMDWLGPKIDWVKSKIPVLRDMWSEAWPIISSVLKTAWKIASPILDTIGSVIQIIWGIFEAAWPSIVTVVETAWAVLEPIFDAVAGGLELVSKGVKWVAEKFGAGPEDVQVEDKKTSEKSKTPSHASGLPYVPRDNYLANLHKGEMVLTRVEADQYRKQMKPVTQTIRQNLIPFNQNTISDGVQKVKQKVTPAETVRLPDSTQTIRQNLIPFKQNKLQDSMQTIKQKILTVKIPKLPDATQIIRQSLIPAEVSNQTLQQREKLLSGGSKPMQMTVNFDKLADTVNASAPEDVDSLLNRLEQRLLQISNNMGVNAGVV